MFQVPESNLPTDEEIASAERVAVIGPAGIEEYAARKDADRLPDGYRLATNDEYRERVSFGGSIGTYENREACERSADAQEVRGGRGKVPRNFVVDACSARILVLGSPNLKPAQEKIIREVLAAY